MIRSEDRIVGQYEIADSAFSFWLTLAVTTLLVAFTAYVLSGAFFEPGAFGPAHRAATIVHART